jgi:uncharacterized protein (TIGR02596 family)
MNRSRNDAFSLLELLAVIAIFSLIAGIVVGPSMALYHSFQLSEATQLVSSQLSLARQTALSGNQVVEVRLYKYTDAGMPGATASFHALQSFKLPQNSSGPTPITNVQRLPGGIVIDGGSALSSLLDSSARTSRIGDISLPGVGTAYTYFSIRFHPDGSTDLSLSAPASSPGCWFLTLHSQRDGDDRSAVPANFATIQLDPLTGATRLFRP